MARYLSLYRRRNNLVDVFFTARPGAKSYQFQFATNFDGAFTTFQVVPATGFASVSANPDIQMADSQFRGKTHFMFAPSDYTTAFPTLVDSIPLYLKIIQTDWDGTIHTAEAMHLVLPYNPAPNRPLVLAGSAPNGAALVNSLEIQLPMQCMNVQIQNNSPATNLFVAFEPSGPEFLVPPLATQFTNFSTTYPSVTQLFVRGSGATCAFDFIGDLRNNPIY